MDKAQEENNDRPAEKESNEYLWLAGAFVGGFLILTIIIIIGILLWKYVKKQNTSIDQNWAGPSPLADGNIQEVGICMNSSILGKNLSLSHISMSPILSNDYQTGQEVHETGGEMQRGNFEEDENEKNTTTISTIDTPVVPAAPTKNTNLALEAQMSMQITENGLSHVTFPQPPLDAPEEFPMPPPPEAFLEQDVKANHLQHFSEMNLYTEDENGTQEPLNLQISDTNALHITNNLEDQLLPPPPPDF